MRSMKIEFSLFSAVLLLGATGCAQFGPAQPWAPTATNASVTAAADVGPGTRAIALILAGEVAAGRGQLKAASVALREAAQLRQDAGLAERAARMAFAAEEPELALVASRVWRDLAPENPLAANLELRALLGLGQAEVADLEAWLDSGHGLQPAEAERQLAAVVAAASPDAQRALNVMTALESARPSAALAYGLGVLAVQFERPEVAVDALERARERGWPAEQCDELMLRVHLAQGQQDAARAVLHRLQQQRAEERAAMLGLGQILLDAEAWDLAQAHFETLQQRWPDDPASLLALGLLAAQAAEDDAAKGYFEALWEQGGRPDEAAWQLGRLASRARDWDAAAEWFGRVSAGGRAVDAELGLAQALARLGQVLQARARLAALRVEQPAEAARSFQAEAELLQSLGQSGEALLVLDAGIQQTGSLSLLYTRALIRADAGQVEAATADLEAILAQEADNVQALNALGYMLADSNRDLPRARELIERALRMRPDDPAIRDSLGWVLFRLGELDRARELLASAHADYPDPEVAAHLGEVMWRQGDVSGAREFLREALRRHPQSKPLNRVWQQMLQSP